MIKNELAFPKHQKSDSIYLENRKMIMQIYTEKQSNWPKTLSLRKQRSYMRDLFDQGDVGRWILYVSGCKQKPVLGT